MSSTNTPTITNQRQEKCLSFVNHPPVLAAQCANGNRLYVPFCSLIGRKNPSQWEKMGDHILNHFEKCESWL